MTRFGTTASSMQTSGATLLLDTYTGAGIAYSVRKLRTAYSGSCIRVVRSSDSTEQDIGFDGSGYLDTAALATFIGSNTGYIGKWYDQSGNANDALGHNYGVNTSTLPEIRISGTTQTLNSKAAVKFSGTRRLAWTATGVSMTTLMTFSPKATMIMMVGQIGSAATNPFVLEAIENQTQDDFLGLYESGSVARVDFGNGGSSMGAAFSTDAQIAYYGQVNGSTYQIWQNNTSLGSATNASSQTLSGTGSNYKIGGSGSSSASIEGYIQEMVVWPESQESNRAAIFTDLDTYYSIP